MTAAARQAVYIPDTPAGIGTPWGDVVTEVLAAPLSAGALSCLSVRLSTAGNRPAYVHHHCDEAVYVLNGPVTVTVGERRLAGLEQGACVYIPRGLSRSFVTDSGSARLLIIQTPADELDGVLAAIAQDSAYDTAQDSAYDTAQDSVPDRGARPYRPSAQLIQAVGACGIELIVAPERPAANHTTSLQT
jgi:mannose-6-phosphate isomerase-like protein (cupin superfamily)